MEKFSTADPALARKNLTVYERAALGKILFTLERICVMQNTEKNWQRHALRSAYFAIDAVLREDIIGVSHADRAAQSALEVIHGSH